MRTSLIITLNTFVVNLAAEHNISITPIDDNPGIYYEYKRLSITKWNLKVILNIKPILQLTISKNHQLAEMIAKCEELLGKDCNTTLSNITHLEELSTLKGLEDKLKEYFLPQEEAKTYSYLLSRGACSPTICRAVQCPAIS